ncbi:hypothetical protein BT96DRAFT_948786 [Gymnopus androsaceus JB14]|uniref:Uncharacterized protein n=1 Tax=Gymnopus androsaceus JB14 TaxID=1447944 RepID=A0A6A4GMD4_9AGAR|nr:hypothetical protein BT96DRAFT_948786 [Gymnopus androsaceus JB14]
MPATRPRDMILFGRKPRFLRFEVGEGGSSSKFPSGYLHYAAQAGAGAVTACVLERWLGDKYLKEQGSSGYSDGLRFKETSEGGGKKRAARALGSQKKDGALLEVAIGKQGVERWSSSAISEAMEVPQSLGRQTVIEIPRVDYSSTSSGAQPNKVGVTGVKLEGLGIILNSDATPEIKLHRECDVVGEVVDYPLSANKPNKTTGEGGSDAESLDILPRERKSIERSVAVLHKMVEMVGTRKLEVEKIRCKAEGAAVDESAAKVGEDSWLGDVWQKIPGLAEAVSATPPLDDPHLIQQSVKRIKKLKRINLRITNGLEEPERWREWQEEVAE